MLAEDLGVVDEPRARIDDVRGVPQRLLMQWGALGLGASRKQRREDHVEIGGLIQDVTLLQLIDHELDVCQPDLGRHGAKQHRRHVITEEPDHRSPRVMDLGLTPGREDVADEQAIDRRVARRSLAVHQAGEHAEHDLDPRIGLDRKRLLERVDRGGAVRRGLVPARAQRTSGERAGLRRRRGIPHSLPWHIGSVEHRQQVEHCATVVVIVGVGERLEHRELPTDRGHHLREALGLLVRHPGQAGDVGELADRAQLRRPVEQPHHPREGQRDVIGRVEQTVLLLDRDPDLLACQLRERHVIGQHHDQ